MPSSVSRSRSTRTWERRPHEQPIRMLASLRQTPMNGTPDESARPVPADHRASGDTGAHRVCVPGSLACLSGLDRPEPGTCTATGGGLDGQLSAARGSVVHPPGLPGQPRRHRRPALRLRARPTGPGPRQPRLRQRRREPRVLVDERLGGRRRRRARKAADPRDAAGRLLQEFRPGRGRLGFPHRPGDAAQHPRRHLCRPRSGVDRRALRRVRGPGAADGGRLVHRGVRPGPPGRQHPAHRVQLASGLADRPPSDSSPGRSRRHPGRHPRRVVHAHRGGGRRRRLHGSARSRLPHPHPPQSAEGADGGRGDDGRDHADRRVRQPARASSSPASGSPRRSRSSSPGSPPTPPSSCCWSSPSR